jgi:hypothetical protein
LFFLSYFRFSPLQDELYSMQERLTRERRASPLWLGGALEEHRYGAVLVSLVLELLELGEALLEPMSLVLLEPMLPLGAEGLAAAFGLVAEDPEPLTGPEGEVALLLSAAEPLLGLVALLEPMLLGLLAVEPLAPESWAKTAGAKAATDSAKPAPTK